MEGRELPARGLCLQGPEEDLPRPGAQTRTGFAAQGLMALGGREPGVLDCPGERAALLWDHS